MLEKIEKYLPETNSRHLAKQEKKFQTKAWG